MTFEAIIGHEMPKRLLERMLAHGRIPTGLLLFGRRGRGKLLLAREWAKAIQCPEGRGGAGCTCRSCRRIDENDHEDVHLLARAEGATTISIDLVRALQEKFMLAPFSSPRRIAIIDEAHLMATEAQNSLLKLLEEPPGLGHLILVTSEPEGLLETIHSRLFRLHFGPLPAKGKDLVRRAHPDVRPDALDRAWQMSEGSPGVAAETLDAFADVDVEAVLTEIFSANGRPFETAESVLGGGKRSKSEAAADRETLRRLFAAGAFAAMTVMERRASGAALDRSALERALSVLSPQALEELVRALLLAEAEVDAYVAPRSVMTGLEIRLQRLFAKAARVG